MASTYRALLRRHDQRRLSVKTSPTSSAAGTIEAQFRCPAETSTPAAMGPWRWQWTEPQMSRQALPHIMSAYVMMAEYVMQPCCHAMRAYLCS